MSNTRKPSAQGPSTSVDDNSSEHPNATTEHGFSAKPSTTDTEPSEATHGQPEPTADAQRSHLNIIKWTHHESERTHNAKRGFTQAHNDERESDYCNDEHDDHDECGDEPHDEDEDHGRRFSPLERAKQILRKHGHGLDHEHTDDDDRDGYDFDESSYHTKVNSLLHELYPTATQQSLDLEGVTPQPLYHDHLHKLYITTTLAPALYATDPIKYTEVFKKLSQCADNVSIVNGKVYHHSRCNMRICPLCSAIKARKLAHKLKRIIRSNEATFRLSASDDNPLQAHKQRVHALCLGFNLGKRCHLHEIRDYVKALNATWQSFYKSKPVDRFVEGFYRAIEVALEPTSETLNAHVHIHATILVDASEGGLTLEEALSYAEDTLIPIWVNRARKTIKDLGLNTTIKAVGQKAFPLQAQNIGELGDWLAYCAKGAIAPEAVKLRREKALLSVGQHADAWIALGSQLKHQRLVSDGGLFKESRRAVERAEELKRLDQAVEAIIDESRELSAPTQAKRKRDERPPRITHMWSHPCGRWKKADEYHHELDCTPEALLRGFQLKHDRDTIFATIQEMRDHQRRVVDHDLLMNAEDQEAENRWRMAYWLATGKAPPKSSKRKEKDEAS